jgi:hypothetical protein
MARRWTLAHLLCVALASGCGGESSSNGGSGSGGSNGTGGVGGGAAPASAERPADYIRNTGFHTLKIELDTELGLSPRNGTTDELIEALSGVVDKPGGIVIVPDETDIPPNEDGIWTAAELDALARERVGIEESDGEISLHTMWLGGEYENPNVVGVAWDNRHLAMFGDRIDRACSGLLIGALTCSLAEATIWTHEVGHVIGLVDRGTPMVNDHKDPEHPAHDVSRESVMYWAYDGTDFTELLGALTGDSVIPWGEECERDLEAVRDAD